jgi:uncharacterized OsmC-like protein
MVKIELAYQGELRTGATHVPSGKSLTTDAPVDNHGKGETFSPTDLVASALGSCMLTIMGITGQEKGISIEGATAQVEKHMSQDEPRRISILDVSIHVPRALDEREMKIMRHAAETCPVAQSINDAIVVNFRLTCA